MTQDRSDASPAPAAEALREAHDLLEVSEKALANALSFMAGVFDQRGMKPAQYERLESWLIVRMALTTVTEYRAALDTVPAPAAEALREALESITADLGQSHSVCDPDDCTSAHALRTARELRTALGNGEEGQ